MSRLNYHWKLRVPPFESAYHECLDQHGKVWARVTNYGEGPCPFHYAIFDEQGVSRKYGYERTASDAKTMVGLT